MCTHATLESDQSKRYTVDDSSVQEMKNIWAEKVQINLYVIVKLLSVMCKNRRKERKTFDFGC